MNKTTATATLILVFACAIARPATAYTVNADPFLFAEENSEGYRRITSIEPAAGERLPLSDITTYPEAEKTGGIEISYKESPDAESAETTLILHTSFPIGP